MAKGCGSRPRVPATRSAAAEAAALAGTQIASGAAPARTASPPRQKERDGDAV